MIRIASSTFAAVAVAAGLCMSGAALAQTAKKPAPAAPAKTPAPAPAATPTEAKPATLGTFGAYWGAFATDTDKGRVCYALGKPKERLPANLNRNPGYLFITVRRGETARYEVSFTLGFPPKDGADGQLTVGKTNYPIRTQGDMAWPKNQADEAALIEQLKKTPNVSLKIVSKRGNQLTDNYVTTGLVQALEQVKKACP